MVVSLLVCGFDWLVGEGLLCVVWCRYGWCLIYVRLLFVVRAVWCLFRFLVVGGFSAYLGLILFVGLLVAVARFSLLGCCFKVVVGVLW